MDFDCLKQCPGAAAIAGYYLYNDDGTVSYVRFEDEAFDQAIAAAERDAPADRAATVCRRHRRRRHRRHSN